MPTKLKSLTVGLDGATWRVLLPLIDLGVIPNIARAVAGGSRGILRSTIPPLTGPAWTTFATGKNPGQHGFFDWGMLGENYLLRMWSAAEVRDQPFWARLSAAGRRVGLFNVPFTYPPEPINGFVVCGMGTPGRRFEWTYPSSLKSDIEQELPPGFSFNFQIVAYARHEFDKLVDDLIALEQEMTRILIRRLEAFPLDDLVVVYVGTDRIGHFLGHCAEGIADLKLLSPEQAAIVRYYRALDVQVGELLNWLDEAGILIAVSDHGFIPARRTVHLNEWLVRKGYLVTAPLSWLKAQAAFFSGAISQRSNQQGQKQSTDAETGLTEQTSASRFNASAHLGQKVNWAKTRAFSNSHNGIYLNTAGRFTEGSVQPGSDYFSVREQLIKDLATIKDPETGQRVIEAVHKREAIYSGDNLEFTPDLVLQFAEDRYDNDRFFFVPHDFGLRVGLSIFRKPSPWGYGTHHRDGILLLSGPMFRSGEVIDPATLEDIAPTILHTLGEAVPSGMTGQVIEAGYRDDFRSRRPIQFVDDPALKAPAVEGSGMSAEEEELVYERLRELGYME